MDNLVDDSDHSEQLVTFPDEDNTPTEERDIGDFSVAAIRASNNDQLALLNNNNNGLLNKVESAAEVVKFEEKRTASASNRKIVTNGFSSEQVRWDIFLPRQFVLNIIILSTCA